jgi:hypothetical protein
VSWARAANTEVDALHACYVAEFGETCYPGDLAKCMELVYRNPEVKDAAASALARAAFDGNLAGLEEALKAGAKATSVLGFDAVVSGDSDREVVERKQREAENRARLMARQPRMFQIPPAVPFDSRKAMFNSGYGWMPQLNSVLMLAVIGAKKQSCLHDRLGAPAWNGLPVVKRLLAWGANPLWEAPGAKTPIAFAISGADLSRPSGPDLAVVARELILARRSNKEDAETLNRWITLAAARGNVSLMQFLADRGAVAGDEALWWAQVHDHEDAGRWLETQGIRLSLSDSPAMRDRLGELLRQGDASGLAFAFKHGADFSFLTEPASASVRNFYVGSNADNPEVLRLLLRAGAQCGTALWSLAKKERAAHSDPVQGAKILLEEFHCDPNMTGTYRSDLTEWPLMWFEDSETELLRVLLEHGARAGPGNAGQVESNPLRARPMDSSATLEWAISRNRPNLAGLVMEIHPPSPDIVGENMQRIVAHGTVEMLTAMLAHGADPSFAHHGEPHGHGQEGVTLLMMAVKEGKLPMAHALLETGADVNAQTDPHPPFPWGLIASNPANIMAFHGDQDPDMHRQTALMYAAQRGDEAMVKLLLKSGADKNIRADSGSVAKDFAIPYKANIAQLIDSVQSQPRKHVVPVMYPLPSDALGPVHVTHKDGSQEDYFWLTVKYPSTAALSHYREVLSDWRECEGNNREWESFVDPSRNYNLYVHQLIRHWVNRDDDAVVTLTLRYNAYKLDPEGAPIHNRQLVSLVRRTQAEAMKAVQAMGDTCKRPSRRRW